MSFFTATARRGRGIRKPAPTAPVVPAVPTIRIDPVEPPAFLSFPATWSPTVYVAGATKFKWAVFQVSTSNQWTSAMGYQEVTVANAAGSTFTPSAPFNGVRERLVVKTLDEAVEAVSGPAQLQATAPSGSTLGKQMALDFRSRLTVQLNIERGEITWAGRMTSAQYAEYKSQGVSGVRHFGIYGSKFNQWPTVTNGDTDWLLDACERAMGAGLYVSVSPVDIMFPENMTDSRLMPLLRNFAIRVRGRNWDVNKYTLGAINEYGGGTNAQHRVKMHECIATLRAELPNTLLMAAGGHWNDPEWMGNFGDREGANDPYVPPPDDRVIHEWHKYSMYATDIENARWYGAMLKERVEDALGIVTICGEWGLGPSTGGAAVQSGNYWKWPGIIDAAARGMGEQAPNFWAVTQGTDWRFNQGDGTSTAKLQTGVADALKAADTYIRAQSYFKPAPATGTPAGGTGSPSNPSTPSTGGVARLQAMFTGQSNQYFADDFGAPGAFGETLSALTGLPVDIISRKQQPDDSTIHSGTFTYWDHPYDNEGRWLAPSNNNYGSDPATWAAQSQMQQTLNATSRYVSTDAAIPLFEMCLHWEYDLKTYEADAQAAYRNGSWEPRRRIRNTRPKNAGMHTLFRMHCPYQGGGWDNLDTISRDWLLDSQDANRNVVICGNMMDGNPNTQWDPAGDMSHWGDQAAPRIYPRIALQVARYAYDKGMLPPSVNLSDLPGPGPRIASAVRSGNSVIVTVAHDKGGALVAGQGGIDWKAFTVTDAAGTSHVEGSGGAILTATTIRVDFPSTPPANGKVWYCHYPVFRYRNLIRDNWHTTRPAKYNTVPNIGVVEFPLQRTLAGVAY